MASQEDSQLSRIDRAKEAARKAGADDYEGAFNAKLSELMKQQRNDKKAQK